MACPRRRSRVGALLPPPPLALLLLGVAVVVALLPLRGGDPFWHLSVGRWIAESGTLPVPDPFSFATTHGVWTPHSPLWGLLLHGAEQAAGLDGLRLLRGTLPLLFGLSLVAWLGPRLGRARAALPVFVGGALAAVIPLANPRPYWLPLILFPLAWRWIEHTLRGERPPLWTYALLSWVWALGHASCLLALLAPSLALMLDALVGVDPREAGGDAPRRLGAAAGLAGVATLATPNGLGLWSYWVDHVPGPFFGGMIKEWAPPAFLGEGTLANLGIATCLALALSLRPRVRRWEMLWVGLWLWSYSRQSRHMGLALMAALGVGAPALAVGADDRRTDPDFRHDRRAVTAWSLGLWGALLSLALALGGLPGRAVDPEEIPRAALDPWLAEARLERSFHLDYWSGYVSWRSRHRVKSFLDGRNDLYGPGPIADYLAILRAEAGWQKAFRRWDFDGVLLPEGHPALDRILSLGGWRRAEGPGEGVVLLRPSPAPGE